MTAIRILLILACFPGVLFSQEKDLRPLDPTLSEYEYPFEVQYLDLHNQQDDLRMAYMDVKPEDPTGRSVVLLHGKNFKGAYWETTIRENPRIDHFGNAPVLKGSGHSQVSLSPVPAGCHT